MGVDAFLARLYQTTETRIKLVENLRSREAWDFFMIVFNGTDTVQHAMWKFMSQAHPLHDPAKAPRLRRCHLGFLSIPRSLAGDAGGRLARRHRADADV